MERAVLVVEDSRTQAERIRLLLEGEGYRVDVARNGREGLERLQLYRPDLVISDVVMPEIDGYAFCQAVKSAPATRRIPFVLLTERNTPADFIKGLRLGADNFITKPFDDDHLVERVQRICENLQLRRSGHLDVEVTLTSGGQQLVINADKQQIIELLFATLEDLVRINGRLGESQRIIEEHARHLRREEEARLRLALIVESSGDAIIGLTLDRIITSWNRGAEQLYGYASAEAIGRPVALLVPSDRTDEVDDIVDRLKRGEQVESFETVRLQKGGRRLDVSMASSATRDLSGNIVGLSSISRDISARKRVEHALREQEERLGAILQTARDAIVSTDSEGRILFWNKAAETMFGYSSDEALGNTVAMLTSPPVDPASPQGIAPALATCEAAAPPKTEELVGRRRDGTEFPFELSLARWKAGSDTCFTAIIRDITARRRDEAKFRGLLEAAPDAMVIVDSGGRITLVNYQVQRLFGYSREELLGQPVELLVPGRFVEHSGHRGRYVADARSRPMGAGLDLYARRKDGTEFPVEISLSPMEVEEGLLITAAIRDITERKRAEEHLQEAHAELKKSHEGLQAAQLQLIEAAKMKSVGRLAAGVAHEVKNPLAVILLGVEYLERRRAAREDERASVVSDIAVAARRADTVIKGLLDFASPRQLTLDRGELRPVLAQSLALVKHVLTKHHVTVIEDVDGSLPPVDHDANKLEQAFVNILLNALDAMPEGGTLRVAAYAKELTEIGAHVGHRQTDRFRVGETVIIVEFDNSGPPIPEESLPRIFEPFFTTKPTGKGTGLGLAVTKTIIDLHGGSIEIGNRPEGGVRVRITLSEERSGNGAKDTDPID